MTLYIGRIRRAQERAFVCQCIVDQVRALHRLWLPDFELWEHTASVVVAQSIQLGHIARMPMTISMLAAHVPQPENSVRRHLEPLLDTGVVRRAGNFYLMDEDRANDPALMPQVDAIVERQALSARLIAAAVNMDTADARLAESDL